MNIGVIGWWHNGNEGDFRILDCMTRALDPHHIVPIDLPFPLNEDSLRRLNLLDFVILGGGGLFQEAPPPHPFQDFDVWGNQLQRPIGVAGVGIDAVLPEYRGSMNALIEQARFFYVRDRTSQRIAGHPKAQVAPDLTFLGPLSSTEARGQSEHDTPACGVNLRKIPGFPLDPWMETLQELPFHLRGIPLATYASWQETDLLQDLDPASATSFDAHLYDGLDLMIGTAFHSVVFAVQAAIPVIGIAYAPKVRRLMTEIGLERFCLEPDEWQRLPVLVNRLMDEHEELSNYLRETTRTLSESAHQTMAAMREEIELAAMPCDRSGTKVSIVIVGDASDQANHATLQSCLAQTYRDVEIILATEGAGTVPTALSPDPRRSTVQCEPQESIGERLNRAFALAKGDYFTWITAGNCYAHDAVACMADRLQREPACDMVFADCFVMHAPDRLSKVRIAGSPERLFRRDVVGPCFLFKRELGETVGPFNSDTALVAYDYWLRANQTCCLQPMHTRLLYALASNQAEDDPQTERRVRRRWRSTQPWLRRTLWRIVDSDLAEHWVLRPASTARRNVRSFFHRFRAN